MRLKNSHTRIGRRVLHATLIASLAIGLMAGSVFAAKPLSSGGGKPTGGGTISNPILLTDANSNGLLNYMDSITFTVSTTATDKPMVGLRCWQGTNFVHDGYIALFEASWLKKYFLLGGSYWKPALDATCTARLFYYDSRSREKLLATLDFGVAP